MKRSLVRHTKDGFHNKQLSHFSRRELISFPAPAFHTQYEFLFLSRRKAPIVKLCYQIQRPIDINKGNENTVAVVILHTFLWASEILMIRHLKVNIFTTLNKQTIFKNPLGLSCRLPELLPLKLYVI